MNVIPMFAHYFKYEYRGQTLAYTVISETDKTCMVVRNPENQPVSGEVVIPSTVRFGTDDYTVTIIGTNAFNNYNGLFNDMTSVEIPNTVTFIGELAFSECKGLTSLDLPGSVTTIAEDAFAHCTGLTSIKIPDSITKLSNSVFFGCSGLTSVEIPGSVTTIGNRAFCYCTGLKSIYIPSSVTAIGWGAFAQCFGLEEIIIDKDNKNYKSIDGVLFDSDCTTLIQFPAGAVIDYVVPATVTTIDSGAFVACRLTSIEIPSSVTAIGEEAFFTCNITSLVIPGSVVTIGFHAFYDCFNLKTVYYDAEEPGTFAEDIFDEVTYWKTKLYVPEAAVEKCRQISPWEYFHTIKAFDFNGVEDVIDNTDSMAPREVFTIGGVKVPDPAETLVPGLYIERQGTVVKKISVK